MSRIGKKPIDLPEGVTVTVENGVVKVKGTRGELSYVLHRDVTAKVEGKQLVCSVARLTKVSSAQWGTARARLDNMVTGVSKGFTRKLELHGVGYRAALSGDDLELQLGYSHPVKVTAPADIKFMVDKEVITVEGVDKVLVGQIAANIRASRKPEPYKGKGVRYSGEIVRRKVGKVVGVTE